MNAHSLMDRAPDVLEREPAGEAPCSEAATPTELGALVSVDDAWEGWSMPDKKRLSLCGCIGLAVASFALIGAIVAQPLLSVVWPSIMTTAQLSKSSLREEVALKP